MMTDVKPNAELAYAVLDHIDAHPETWQQSEWWCGTGGCFAGWTATLSGEKPGSCNLVWVGGTGMHVGTRAAQLLGFANEVQMDSLAFEQIHPGRDIGEVDRDDEGEWELFSAVNTRDDLGRIVGVLFGPRPTPDTPMERPI